ncbi:response regulator [Mucilaginibacter sp. 14171R-50]|uniref:response regulator n=1 Tax=Mucilaginibacter sp. 14171R-50 TaxID=2703789 RepID=UPI00138CB969|nr:response regulator [Mucilaginibacter sp. 14171R-50]QHS56522.1 response regulator [Mucilaginibacter sp. 14171R-50]
MKIAIIENQYDQFDVISGLLEEYTLFPDYTRYKNFLDKVRIHLNTRYSKEQKAEALQSVIKDLQEFKPDLLIIDHILVGNHSAENGIQLAKKLRKEMMTQPILFLSRTEQNHVDVCKYLPEVKAPVRWVSKGYSGEEILEPEYFKQNVISQIKELLNESVPIIESHYLLPIIKKFEEIETNQNGLSRYRHNKSLIPHVNQFTVIIQNMKSLTTQNTGENKTLVNLCETIIRYSSQGEFGNDECEIACKKLEELLRKL